jgi:diguanylate cyclase (GGDEF)-like protein
MTGSQAEAIPNEPTDVSQFELRVAYIANELLDRAEVQLIGDESADEDGLRIASVKFAIAAAECAVLGEHVDRGLRSLGAERVAPELVEDRRSLERLVEVDSLTGLGNERAFEKAQPKAEQDPEVSFIFMDGNSFKHFNDAHGHDAGDALIKGFAAAVRQAAYMYGFSDRVFRRGQRSDEIIVLAKAEVAEPIILLARELLKQSIEGGESFLDSQGRPHNSSLFRGYGFSAGIAGNALEAEQAMMVEKARFKASQGTAA